MASQDTSKLFPNFITNIAEKMAPKSNIDTSTKEQWNHLDVGTASFVTCIIAFCICFSYLVPRSSKIRFIALVICLCITAIFPLSWMSSVINYPSRNTKYYILTCLFVGIILEFTALLMSVLSNNHMQNVINNQNSKIDNATGDEKKIVKMPQIIDDTNQTIFILFTTTITLMIGCIATYFYDEVTTEKEMMSSGLNIKPASTMGTNIHWWLTFFYDKANDLDKWWHSYMDLFAIPSVVKMFILFVIGFLLIFFIFVDVRIYDSPGTSVKVDGNDYVDGTSLPNTKSPVMQNGVFLDYDKKLKPRRVKSRAVYVRYLPNSFTPESYSNLDLKGLLSFFLTILICILLIPTLYVLHLLMSYLNSSITFFNPVSSPMKLSLILIVAFLLSFLLFFFYFPSGENMTFIYILITFTFAVLVAPVMMMILEMFFTMAFQTSLSQTSWGWYILIGLLFLIWGVSYSQSGFLFNTYNMINNLDTNASVLQLFLALLIALTVGWFFGLSFHFDTTTFLFVLVFTPMKYVFKVLGPIAILGLTIAQVILASKTANSFGTTTDG